MKFNPWWRLNPMPSRMNKKWIILTIGGRDVLVLQKIVTRALEDYQFNLLSGIHNFISSNLTLMYSLGVTDPEEAN